jgi:DNA-binding response OmpR family regulator
MNKKNFKIIIAEDDILLRYIWQQKIAQEGFEVITAADGDEALEQIEKEKPDLLLLDIVMPRLDGFDVLKAIRKHSDEKIKNMTVVVLSNLGSEEDVKKASALGSDGYMVKAMFSTDDVIAKVKEHEKRLN